jgi:glycosyltransferase 2 family protein
VISTESENIPQPSALKTAWNGWPGRIVRLALALLPLIWLTRKVEWASVVLRAKEVGVQGLVLSLVGLVISISLGAVRWANVMRAYGATRTPPFPVLFKDYLIGLYFNVIPSGVAGDAVRAHRHREVVGDMTASFTVTFIERIAGLLGLCVVAVIGFVSASGATRDDFVAQVLELGLLGALVLSVIVLLTPWVLSRSPVLRQGVGNIPVLGAVLLRVPMAKVPWRLALAVAQSVGTQAFIVTCIASLVIPLAPHMTLMVCARVVPAIILTTYVPLTPGGIGQREVVFRYMFGLVGVAGDVAVAVSLLFFAELMTLSGVGGLFLLAERIAAKNKTET